MVNIMLLIIVKNSSKFVSLKYGFANSKVTVCDYLTSFLSENCTDIFAFLTDGRLVFTDHTTVDIEPPVADEVLLVVEGAVGAEQAGDGRHGVLGPADVVHLAVSLLD